VIRRSYKYHIVEIRDWIQKRTSKCWVQTCAISAATKYDCGKISVHFFRTDLQYASTSLLCPPTNTTRYIIKLCINHCLDIQAHPLIAATVIIAIFGASSLVGVWMHNNESSNIPMNPDISFSVNLSWKPTLSSSSSVPGSCIYISVKFNSALIPFCNK